KEFEKIAEEKCGALSYLSDLVDVVWKDRPPLPTEKAFFLDEFYSGETAASKLERVRCKMDESGADVHLLSSLD
ncbi:aminopeptidase P family N-terminal domain-containing protein, partial [Agathobaculum butyriciproducens]|nr:aminopeptidase P family N-terminal domain-containing protein [Agathobaculum butyriciproducens]